MFTGIVQALGVVESIEMLSGKVPSDSSEMRMIVQVQPLFHFDDLILGESVAVNGVCLTVEKQSPLTFFVSSETLLKTNLKSLRVGQRINLERSLRMGDRLSGHWVLGHVDGEAKVLDWKQEESSGSWDLRISLSSDQAPFVVSKGSITLNGVSLTINSILPKANEAQGEIELGFRIIPHTYAETNLSQYPPGSTLNFEVDVLAKHVAKHLESFRPLTAISPGASIV